MESSPLWQAQIDGKSAVRRRIGGTGGSVSCRRARRRPPFLRAGDEGGREEARLADLEPVAERWAVEFPGHTRRGSARNPPPRKNFLLGGELPQQRAETVAEWSAEDLREDRI